MEMDGPSGLRAMMERYAQPGRVAWIGLRPGRREAMVAVERAEVTTEGLAGDHGRAGPRAVTLIEGEHLPVIGAFLGRGAVDPRLLRRNIAVTGINLGALKDRPLTIGTARLRILGACHPCSRMEEALGPGGYSAMRHHSGGYAEVLGPGRITLGDAVTPEG
jgi:MOSC domain-containing protein YiiM